MEIFKNIATAVGCVSSCIALLITIIKPLRQAIVNSIANKSQYRKMADNIENLNKKLDESLANDTKIQERIVKIEQKVLENEAERLKSELSTYYNRCCRGLQILPEEMLQIEDIYDRYHNKLGLNHIGTNMYDAISQYYKQQDFIKMKQG